MKQWLDRHERALSILQSAVSIVRRLPDDILRLIFSFVVEAVPDHRRLDTNRGAWTLSQVCTRWRSIALSMPSLWSTIMIEGSFLNRRTLRTLNNSLSRTCTAGLSIHVKSYDCSEVSWHPSTYSSRWESVYISVAPQMYLHLTAITSTPLLKRIEIDL